MRFGVLIVCSKYNNQPLLQIGRKLLHPTKNRLRFLRKKNNNRHPFHSGFPHSLKKKINVHGIDHEVILIPSKLIKVLLLPLNILIEMFNWCICLLEIELN